MFVKQIGQHTVAFRDVYSANLNEELYGHPQEANQVIDEIFNLDQVLIADPQTVGSGFGESAKRWISVEVTVMPIDNDDDCKAFNEVLKSIRGVRFAQPVMNVPATTREEIDHLYGGTRTKEQ